MIRWFLTWLVQFLPKRVIVREGDGDYLERYYLGGNVGGLNYFPEGNDKPRWFQRWTTWLPCVYLHRFARSDEDVELHNHPWEAKSLILVGGYVEEYRAPAPLNSPKAFVVKRRTLRPGDVNTIGPSTFHRATLIEHDAWTLIMIGKKVQTWGFWHPVTGEFIHWKEHLARRKARANSRGGQA